MKKINGALSVPPALQLKRARSSCAAIPLKWTPKIGPVGRPNQVWAADITCVPLGRGFLYRVAAMDWSSRAVLSWRVSNTMDVSFCVSALAEVLARFGRPEIVNSDQGSQSTSAAFTGMLAATGIRISTDGRGRWMDDVFIKRLWRSLRCATGSWSRRNARWRRSPRR